MLINSTLKNSTFTIEGFLHEFKPENDFKITEKRIPVSLGYIIGRVKITNTLQDFPYEFNFDPIYSIFKNKKYL